jgi:hypothetical protein
MNEEQDGARRGPDKDPALFAAFVEFRLKHGAGREEIIAQLIAKGLTRAQASTLTDSVDTRLAVVKKMSAVGGLVIVSALGGALAGMLLGATIWAQFFTGAARPAGLIAVGVLTAAGSVIGAWGRQSSPFAPAACILALVGMALGTYVACDVDNPGLIQTLRTFDPMDASMFNCMKMNLIGHYDLAWAAGSLIATWIIARKQWLQARIG